MTKYRPQLFEKKWLDRWKKEKLYDFSLKGRNNYYVLVELPYTSGDLHIGHWFTFTTADVLSRYKRMSGYNVFFPMGYDAFGLPAENAAIKHHIHPKDWTMKNIETMTNQFQTMATMLDWKDVVITCLPEYYRWNQWFFIKLFEQKLAYRGKTLSNWCETDQTVLANENIENGKCWRCGNPVIQKEVEQWFIKITEYADKLIWPEEPAVDWPMSVRVGQNNWIGRKEGVLIKHKVVGTEIEFETFSAFPSWLFADTFIVIAPEHPLVKTLVAGSSYENSAKTFIDECKKLTSEERTENKFEKKGVFTGKYAKDPFGGADMPIWVANFALLEFGTGIIRCSAHDTRDYEFAQKYGIPLKEVVARVDPKMPANAHKNEGVLRNSGPFTGKKVKDAIQPMLDWIEEKRIGRRTVNYHLHDWSISRQRYWGTPVPMVHCKACGIVPVAEKDLPVELPYKVDFTPKGKPPLATNEEWSQTTCPRCGGEAQRDAETLDTFFDSAWYYYRYLSPHYEKGPFEKEKVQKIMPLDVYFGGSEHTLGHTLYARFFTKFLKDIGLVDFDEFAKKRIQHGVVLGPDGNRMSKSKGNVINPDDVVSEYGADAVRMYLCFMMPYESTGPWSAQTIAGVYRFLKRVWEIYQRYTDKPAEISKNQINQKTDRSDKPDSDLSGLSEDKGLVSKLNKTVQKVTKDIESIKMNTAIAAMMEFMNLWEDSKAGLSPTNAKKFLQILAPFAPLVTEEIWREVFAEKSSIHLSLWPKVDRKTLIDTEITIPVQVDGKIRGIITIPSHIQDQDTVVKKATEDKKVAKYIKGKQYNVVYVKGKILSLVTQST